MKPRLNASVLGFGLLGGLLLIDLLLPVTNLLLQADWVGWTSALGSHGENDALKTSLTSSSIAVLLMLVFGVPLGYLLSQPNLPFRRFWTGLVFLPMVVPDLAGGILLLQTFGPYSFIQSSLGAGKIELTNNLAGIVLVQIFVASPFVVVSSLAAFASVDPKLQAAATILGDTPWRVFWRVSLPLAWPGIAGGITLAWIRALGEFGATMIVAYSPHTLPVYMWMKFESDGLAGALPIAFCLLWLAAAAVGISVLLDSVTARAQLLAPRQRFMGARA